MLPEVKFVYEVSVGQLVTWLILLGIIWRAEPHYRQFITILAQHDLLVSDYAERKGIDRKDVSRLALAEVAIRTPEPPPRGRGDRGRNR